MLTLYTKEDCTLCEEAKEDLFASGLNVELKEVDITEPENSKWFGLYRYEIPVFYLEDKFLSKNFLDLKELEKRLSQS